MPDAQARSQASGERRHLRRRRSPDAPSVGAAPCQTPSGATPPPPPAVDAAAVGTRQPPTSTETSVSTVDTSVRGVCGPTPIETPPVCTVPYAPPLTSVTYACLPLAPNQPLTSIGAMVTQHDVEETQSVSSHRSIESRSSTASRVEARIRAAEYKYALMAVEAQRRRAAEEERLSLELAKKKLDADVAAARADLEDEISPPDMSGRPREDAQASYNGVGMTSPRANRAQRTRGDAPPGALYGGNYVRQDIMERFHDDLPANDTGDGGREESQRRRSNPDPPFTAGGSRTDAGLPRTHELQPSQPLWCEREATSRDYDDRARQRMDTIDTTGGELRRQTAPPPPPTATPSEHTAPPPPAPGQTYLAPAPLQQQGRAISWNETQILAEALKRVARPPTSLPIFSGDVREFLAFRASYHDSTAAHKYTASENMIRLRTSLRGEARETVAARLFTIGDPDAVMTILERNYGRPEILISTEVQRVMDLPRIHDNANDLQMIASRVDNCVATVKAMRFPAYLHSPELVRSVLSKMTALQRAKYIDYSKGRTYELTGTPELETINNFLTSEAENAVRLAAYTTTPTAVAREGGVRSSRARARTGATKRAREVTPLVFTATPRGEACVRCHGPHMLVNCDRFTAASVDERWTIARSAGICFKCLGGKHRWPTCKSRPCGVNGCRKPHHKLLHRTSGQHNDGPRRRRGDNSDNGAPPSEKRRKSSSREGGRTATSAGEGNSGLNRGQNLIGSFGRSSYGNPLDGASGPETAIETPLSEADPLTNTICAVTSHTVSRRQTKDVFLKIAPVTLQGPISVYDSFALLDDGSTITLLQDKAADRIGAKGPFSTLNVLGIGGQVNCSLRSRRVDIKIAARGSGEWHILEGARTVNDIGLGSQTIDRAVLENCVHLCDLSDQLLHRNATPMILVGQDNWSLIVTRELREGRRNQPVASKTALGWVLHGFRSAADTVVNFRSFHTRETADDELHRLVRANYDLEALGVIAREPRAPSDERALQILESATMKTASGRYETGLLWKEEDCRMPPSEQQALVRLRSVERKMNADLQFEAQYKSHITALLDSGYAEICPPGPSLHPVWYLPHFAVQNPRKSGKIRVVFDAAARVNNTSLNDNLLTGPDLLQSLLGVLLRFREGAVAAAGDIKEMFLRVEMRTPDRDAQRFVWRNNSDEQPRQYRMTTLIFGASSSPCSALFVKNKNARATTNDPDVIAAIERDHYMDDAIISTDSEEKMTYLVDNVTSTHAEGGFEIRGWTSNRPAALRNVPESARGSGIVDLATSATAYERTLGMIWHTELDELAFDLSMHRVPQEVATGEQKPTKRQMLTLVMSIFDPLGLLSIITTAAKILLQRAWRAAIGWDDKIDDNLHKIWTDWLRNLRNLREIRIPRHYGGLTSDVVDLHIFCDASAEAYASVAYWRVEPNDENDTITVLVASKSRVAPLRPTSIPRLELQAALLGVRLGATITKEHRMRPGSIIYWSDSRTALTWIRAEARRYKPFVAHRVAEIQDLSRPDQWRWVPTKLNAADLATRPPPPDVDSKHWWFRGPDFLRRHRREWPVESTSSNPATTKEEETEVRRTFVAHTPPQHACLPQIERFSNWNKLIRATARVLQFVDALRSRRDKVGAFVRKRGRSSTKVNSPLLRSRTSERYIEPSHANLRAAENLWICQTQENSFPEEMKMLRNGGKVKKTSRLATLAPQLGKDGELYAAGRINAAAGIAPEMKNPVILDGREPYVRLLITHYHHKYLHANHETVVNEIRQRYWILRLRGVLRNIVFNCLWCNLRKGVPSVPPPGDLPLARLRHHERPFTATGVDYFGPMNVTVGRHHEKRYGALFTCLTTRAVHIELAASLSADSMILALRRMIARRGTPAEIYSDNGTNFVGARRELQEARDELVAVGEAAKQLHINWRTIPAGAPTAGGSWERLVRSIKTSLAGTLRERTPREEVLATLLLEAENIVNCRPLTHISAHPEDEEALTPNHFLIGTSSGTPSPARTTERDLVGKNTWRTAQRLADHFWSRWVREYLPLLQPRGQPGSQKNLSVGDLVLVADHTLPRNTWPRGRISEVYPGPDGRVRVADVQTAAGELRRRPVRRLVHLPTTGEKTDVPN